MDSSSVQLIQDDEEDFDWEAAVREIDVACLSTAAKTLETPPPPPPPPPFEAAVEGNKLWKNQQLNKFQNNCRQSTLDKFISSGSSKPSTDNEIKVCGEDEQNRVQERACYVDIDPEAAKTWIYPDNVSRREYQLSIAKTALFSNTLVALPTGLGKTLIAAVVMFNYFRWFPEGKIVFAAPSRPLVMQQIEACHNIVGIPQEWAIDMTGLTSPPKRASLWKSKRVFFVTPQVLEKDIQSGACLVKYLVCLVIDEAHRAMGNYSYCVAVRELLAVPVEMRILALTATPGSKKETIQQVIDNLQISTLEYRNDSDVDVCPYVHNRTLELIEVPMGKDADEIHNLLLEVIRPLAARLCAMGVLPGRDPQTLSPCDLLNSRDRFRQAPPPDLSHVKCSEVEGYFGVLITLYHIRKLLSSHGIRPAHEMLEEKLRQGYFARLMSRNEAIQRTKLLMQKSLSHGAPSPKLSKMIEILVDHFTNDPANSRVIIFSNFRGSVRDILDSLAHVGSVKATQFIGQSSGKTLKGQSQKVQQAVLEKFRMGGYNVIVATSIGEEGLDIMEVDLVICFDANISPLRMIQRMGRTGRKHDGRVVVLACEGTEIKGYKRKQATGKTVGKHMQNGGMNSFNFHCSPRMIPHLLKPELQFVELSIEKFIRPAKKVKVDSPQQPEFRERLVDAEAALLGKYFLSNEAIKPSLVAFPYFQTCPSRVHRVMHSSRTGWLIDAMQLLRGLPSNTGGNFSLDYPRSTQCLLNGSVEKDTENAIDVLDPANVSATQSKLSNFEVSPSETLVAEEKHMLHSPDKVMEVLVPLPAILPSDKHTMLNSSVQDVCEVHSGGRSQLPADWEMFDVAVGDAIIVHTPPFDDNCPNDSFSRETADAIEPKSPATPAAQRDLDVADSDFSPRLTSLIESGVVPESPLSNAGDGYKKDGDIVDWQSNEEKDENLVPEQILSPKYFGNSLIIASKEVNATSCPQTREVRPPVGNETSSRSPNGLFKTESTSMPSSSPEFRTPLRNLTNSSCDEDWRMSSGKMSGSNERPFRLKRLRRIGDFVKEKKQGSAKEKPISTSTEAAFEDTVVLHKAIKHGKVKKPFEDARDFIDEEAEVSSEDVVPDSEDEVNYEDSDAYEESFIDDQSDQAVGSGQTEDTKTDMMAIYRRSLLTQSPYQPPKKSSVVTPESLTSVTTMTEGGESFGKSCTLQTQGCLKSPNLSIRNSVDSRLNMVACEAIPSSSSNALVNVVTTQSLKRKMISSRAFTLPAKNLEKEFYSDSALPSKEASISCQGNVVGSGCTLSDDQFYEGLDLDELEAQAAKLLSQRTGSSVQGKKTSEPPPQNTTLLGVPSFDLGIS
ncbi:DEAD-box ATP-dependent RNA helicase FANCM isoform X2 [Spinacia oleracea]|uniref:DEAD-box ATP-dependent RNA helicase FANCM isoform X2 n=1 Tax=Spinacia oleracea TaxID=3562 RepID=A0A9R0IFA2_SPIOL|nr:DEAD-box ATP-dependent RNA helicase FANCM isoform X2 [Spinacia oleracea]